MGAQALLISHDPEEWIDTRFDIDSDSRYDGTGHTIDIPTLIIKVEDGKKLFKLQDEDKSSSGLILKADIEIIDKE